MAKEKSVDDMIITVSLTLKQIRLIHESLFATIALIGGRKFSNPEVSMEQLHKINDTFFNAVSISKFERYKMLVNHPS